MAEVQQFAYGWINPAIAYLVAAFGCGIGLVCTARARKLGSRVRRQKWLAAGAVAIGGTGIWPMHFLAMLGFDVPTSAVRYDVPLTVASVLIAILSVGIGLFVVGHGDTTLWRILPGGLFTGLGVAAMHYTGMAAMRVGGTVGYDRRFLIASVVVAVVASTVALWFTVRVDGWGYITGAALVMGVAVVGMHYTGMFGVHVHLDRAAGPVDGANPFLFIAPITALVSCALFGLFFSVLTPVVDDPDSIRGELLPPVPDAAPAAAPPAPRQVRRHAWAVSQRSGRP